jgi:hypothetical protein
MRRINLARVALLFVALYTLTIMWINNLLSFEYEYVLLAVHSQPRDSDYSIENLILHESKKLWLQRQFTPFQSIYQYPR